MDPPHVQFDSEQKIWFRSPEPNIYEDRYSVGQVIVQRLKQINRDKIIEINFDDQVKITAGELLKLSVKCAVNLTRLGVKKGDVVFFSSNLNRYLTASIFGCYIIGAIIHPLDAQCTEKEVDYAISITEPVLVLCEDSNFDLIENVIKTSGSSTKILSFGLRNDGRSVVDNLLAECDQNAESFKAPDLGNNREVIAALMCSSGTSGTPKVTAISNATLINGTYSWWHSEANSVICCSSVLRWISQISLMIHTIITGATRITSNNASDPEIIIKLIETHKVTHMFISLVSCIEILKELNLKNQQLPSLKILLTGGEVLYENLSNLSRTVIPNGRLEYCYGMTEFGAVLTISQDQRVVDSTGCYLNPGLTAKIVDENQARLGPNEKGQICLKSKYIFSRYWKGARTTAEAFDSEGWFLTGDYGYFGVENLLHVVDRYREIITCNGKKILPSDIERLINKHPAIQAGVVVGIPHETKGQLPVAFIIRKPSHLQQNDDELRKQILDFLKTSVSKDEFPVGGINFVEKFPRNKTGKILRPLMKEIAFEIWQKNQNGIKD